MTVKSIFILYMPGHAGNFLTRLFSLSPETVPQVPIPILRKSIRYECPSLPLINRLQWYSYSTVLQNFSDWQQFHRHWPDYHDRVLFNHFNKQYNPPFSHIVYSIHPHEFDKMKLNIMREQADFYCVDLDTRFDPWVFEQQKKLGYTYRPDYAGELDQFNTIRSQYNMKPINLTAMLTSENLFVDEYHRIAESMGLTVELSSATQLYKDWMMVRGPK